MLFSTAVTVAAFVPLFTMQGVEGQIFNPMARTYGYALFGALIATFTVTPVLASYLLPEHVAETETLLVRVLRGAYTPVLRWSLSHRKIMAVIAAACLGVFGLVAPRLGTEFLPALEEGNLWIRATMPPTISLEAGMPIVSRIRDILLQYPEVITVVSQHGRPDNGSDAAGFNNVELFVPLKRFDEWPPGVTKEKIVEELQTKFANEFAGIGFNFSQYIQDNVEEGLSGVKGANSVKIIGRDLAKLEKISAEVMKEMAKVPGVTDLGVFPVLGQPNLNIKVDRERAARYGLNAGDINSVVQAALGGTAATTLLEADRQFNVTVRLATQYRDDIDTVRNIKVGLQTPARRQCLHSAERACGYFARYRRLLHLSRAQRAIYPDQVQRPRARSRRHRGRGAAAHRQERQAAERLSYPLGRRVRGVAASQGASGDHRPDQSFDDPRAPLRSVQFAA